MTLADKIVLLHAGKDTERFGSIAQIGAPLDLYHRPKSKFVAGFIGSPRMNFLPAKVTSIESSGVTVTLEGSGESVRLPFQGDRLNVGAPVTFGVRPEHLEPTRGGSSGQNQSDASERDNVTLTRTITLVEALGEHSYVHLEQPGGAVLIAKAPGDARLKQGDRARFCAPSFACHLFAEDGFALAPLDTIEQHA
jgi:multiple sugar transport system ATP-binding protein